jgi:hypothetical protein
MPSNKQKLIGKVQTKRSEVEMLIRMKGTGGLPFAHRGNGIGFLLLEIRDPLLDIAFESMRSHPAALTGTVGVELAHPETPGRSVLGHRTPQIGVRFETLSGADQSVTSWNDFQRHSDLPLS